MDHKNVNISTNIQRQKLAIAVIKRASWDPSHEGLPRTGLFTKRPPKSNKWGRDLDMEKNEVTITPPWPALAYALNMYVSYVYM